MLLDEVCDGKLLVVDGNFTVHGTDQTHLSLSLAIDNKELSTFWEIPGGNVQKSAVSSCRSVICDHGAEHQGGDDSRTHRENQKEPAALKKAALRCTADDEVFLLQKKSFTFSPLLKTHFSVGHQLSRQILGTQ